MATADSTDAKSPLPLLINLVLLHMKKIDYPKLDKENLGITKMDASNIISIAEKTLTQVLETCQVNPSVWKGTMGQMPSLSPEESRTYH